MWCAVAGMLGGFATGSEVWATGSYPYAPSWIRLVALPLVVALGLSLISPRLRTVVLGTIVFGATNLIVNWVSAVACCPFTNGAWIPWWISSVPSAVFLVGILPAFACAAWAVWRSVSFFGVAPVEQDGRLCWHCGYELGDLPRCPECGRDLYEQSPPAWWPWLAAGLRRSRAAMVVATSVVIGVATFWVTTRTIPTWRFMRCLPGATWQPGHSHKETWWSEYGPCLSVPLTYSGDSLEITYFPRNQGSTLPAMQIVVRENYPCSDGTLVGVFDRRQANWVLRHGFPDAMREETVRHYHMLTGPPDVLRRNEPRLLNVGHYVPEE
jgi:hypothetical protein